MKYLIALSVLCAAAALSACTGEQPAAGGERIGNSSTLPPDDDADAAPAPEDVAEPPEDEAAPEGDDASGDAIEPDASDAGAAEEEEAPE